MLLSKLVGERVKETPSDAVVRSHILMLRAGYIKQVGAGIYTLSHLAKRATQNIEKIIRDEMDKSGAQEVSFPVVMPRELWEETGRYTSIGGEMVRFNDRTGHGMLLGMTHEEAAVHFARHNVKNYRELPFCIYQIQTKFRDEARSRAGLIRVREFVMKDAYSFHESEEDLKKYYDVMLAAYNSIFRRIGMKNFISVSSDSGMMGGSVAHEFMLLTDAGEDTLAICPKCGYKANVEVAESRERKAGDPERVQEGHRCKVCGAVLTLKNGIEIGNIFQLGTKYSKGMNMTIIDRSGVPMHPIMGCYGIGVGRALASLIEESGDEKGIKLPLSIAPYKVHMTPLNLNDANVSKTANALYKKLTAAGIETLFDDREVSAGVKFADADLMGMPIRLLISPKSLGNSQVELSIRESGEKVMLPIADAVKHIKKLVKNG